MEATENLSTGPWTPLGPSVAGTGNEIFIEDTTSGLLRRFYRLRAEVP